MIIKKYDYLEENFVRFGYITQEDISTAENLIGIKFPDPLKEFWFEMGYGHYDFQKLKIKDLENEILGPMDLANTILQDEEKSKILTYILEEYLEDGDIPFFHVGNSDCFLKFRSKSDKPKAIYDMWNHPIEENLEKFIWRLYHESPKFYWDIEKI